jgi:hypothetical protein
VGDTQIGECHLGGVDVHHVRSCTLSHEVSSFPVHASCKQDTVMGECNLEGVDAHHVGSWILSHEVSSFPVDLSCQST